ncbi:serine hydrolase [Streptomyces sp. NPDC050433]|uniref:serine hydrolase n=1 Tax=Streptomyces sp. NPDC050433 TaxID=3365615 RepID=UPI0037A8BD04
MRACGEPLVGTADENVTYDVAVRDTATGTTAAYRHAPVPAPNHPTASVVKLGILAALLLRAQDTDREPTPQQRASAADMIERSDNDAATALLNAVGGAGELDAAHRRLGLRESAAAPDWGMTRTTATDQLALLGAVFGGGPSPLDERSRAFVRDLMTRVVPDQAWGVSAAGSAPALKNGWMPLSATGLWVVNSVGRVTTGDRDYLVAVLSGGHPTKDAGIALVEAVARAAVSATGGGR